MSYSILRRCDVLFLDNNFFLCALHLITYKWLELIVEKILFMGNSRTHAIPILKLYHPQWNVCLCLRLRFPKSNWNECMGKSCFLINVIWMLRAPSSLWNYFCNAKKKEISLLHCIQEFNENGSCRRSTINVKNGVA